MSVRRNWMSLRAFNSSWTREEKLNTISTRKHVLLSLLYMCINFVCLYWIKYSTSDHGLRMVTASPFIHQSDRVAPKASDVSAADWRYQTRVIIIVIFTHVQLRLFSGLEILVKHRILCNKVVVHVKDCFDCYNCKSFLHHLKHRVTKFLWFTNCHHVCRLFIIRLLAK